MTSKFKNMQYVIILIMKVLMILWYFISQFFHLIFTLKFKGISPKEIWFNGWKRWRYNLMFSPSPRDAMWGIFEDYSDFFYDRQDAHREGGIWRHFV